MLRTVLWIAAACAAVLLALAVSRGMKFGAPPAAPEAPAAPAVSVEPPPAAIEPPPLVTALPLPPPPVDAQVEEDAAATGMTTLEPETSPAQDPPTD